MPDQMIFLLHISPSHTKQNLKNGDNFNIYSKRSLKYLIHPIKCIKLNEEFTLILFQSLIVYNESKDSASSK